MIQKILSAIGLLVTLLPAITTTPSVAQEKPSYRYVSTSFSVTEVDTSKLLDRLGRVGVTIPFEMEGKVSAKLQIAVPINGLRDTKAYRFQGTISSESLKVAGLHLLKVEMEADYRDGILNLNPLAFRIPDPQPDGLPPGKFRGTGRLEIEPRGELALNLQLETVPASALNDLVKQPGLLTGGQLSGKVEVTMPASDVRDLSTWNLEGQFSATGLKAMDRELQKASFQFLAKEGELNIKELSATMEGARLQGSAIANLLGKRHYTSDLKLSVTGLNGFVPEAKVVQLSNPLKATATLSGTLTPLKFLVTGEATLPATTIGPLNVQSGSLNYSVNEEKFSINDLNLKLYEGAITGSATLPRQGETVASLALDLEPALSLGPLAEDLSGQKLQLAGRIQGSIQGKVPRPKLSDPSAWEASAKVSIQQGTAWGLDIGRAAIQVLLQNGMVSISETGLAWANSALDVTGTLQLAKPQTFEAEVKLNANDLKNLNRLAKEVRLPVNVEGRLLAKLNVSGQLEKPQWKATGTMESDQLKIDKVRVNAMSAKVTATPESVVLEEFQLKLYEGKVTGTGLYPLNAQPEGKFQLDAEAIDVGDLARAYLGTSSPIKGILSGQLTADSAPPLPQKKREWSTAAKFQIPEITIDAIEAGHLDGKLDYKNQQLNYRVTGEIFDGEFEISGEYPTNDSPPPAKPDDPKAAPSAAMLPGTGKITLDNLQLQKVWRAFSDTTNAGTLAGLLKIELEWSSANESKPSGSGSVVLTNTTWNGRQVVNRLESQIQIRDDQILVNNIRGTAAGGQVEASVVWGLKNAQSRLVKIRARNLDLGVVTRFTPLDKEFLSGRADLEARILPREIWRFEVKLLSQRLQVQGVSVQSVTLPIRGSIRSSFERGEMTLSSIGASVASGRIKGRIALGWGDRRRIEGELKFAKIDTQLLVRESFNSDLPGDGKLSGSIRLDGQNMTSWAETKWKIDAKLSRAQPRRLPVVDALQSVTGTIAIAQPIEEGRINATYSQKKFTIQSILLTGPTLELLIWGIVSSNGRLKLNGLIRTGRRSIDRRISHLVGGQLGNRLLGLLADRLIQVHITGTVNRPIVHVKPLSILSIKALQ